MYPSTSPLPPFLENYEQWKENTKIITNIMISLHLFLEPGKITGLSYSGKSSSTPNLSRRRRGIKRINTNNTTYEETVREKICKRKKMQEKKRKREEKIKMRENERGKERDYKRVAQRHGNLPSKK